MKIKIALITVAAAIIISGIWFAPKGQSASPVGTAATNVVVVDHEGDKVKGATITITDGKGAPLSNATTTDEGTVRPHFPADGVYSIRAALPKDFVPKDDTDGPVSNAPCSGDLLLCITVNVKGTDVRLVGAQLGLNKYQFTVTDEKPEPRIEVRIIDVDNTNTYVDGGTLSISEAGDPTKVAYSEPNKSGLHTTNQLTAGNFLVRWSPSGTHGLAPGQTNPQVVQVGQKVIVVILAKQVNVSTGSEIQPPERQTGGSFRVRDVDTKQLVNGGTVTKSFIDQTGTYKQTVFANTGDNIFIEFGSLIIHLSALPENYELVSKVTVHTYAAGTTSDVFYVDVREIKQAPPTTTLPPIVEPEEEPAEEIRIGPAEPQLEEAPVEEEVPAEDVAVDPALAEQIADCFMYLEMYPQLQELDPMLPATCESNVAFARGVISNLLTELGL
jgi:hypothetical protein